MQETNNLTPPTSKKKLLIWLHAGFLLIGIITVLMGQILPILSKRLSLDDNQAGYFFIAQFSGSLTGVFLYNQGIRRLGHPKTLLIGFCLMAAGCLGLNAGSFFLCLPMVFLYGIGIGSSIPTVNLLVVELNPARSSPALNLINFFWGVGAIICKPYVDFVGTPDSFLIPTALLAFLLLAAGFLIGSSKAPVHPDTPAESDVGETRPIWRTPTAWLIAVFNFIHIGIESSVGGWITTFEERLTDSSPWQWLSAALVFFFFLVLGRGVAPVFLRLLNENSLLILNLLLMTGGALLVFKAGDFRFLLLGVSVLGFGSSSVFPTNMSRFTKIFGPESSRRATPIFIAGSVGGAFMTWLVGFLSATFEDLRIGFLSVLTGCLSLIVLQLIIARNKSGNL
ncbi:MAG: MFS transporter [Pyrinomonadaceae bacterium]